MQNAIACLIPCLLCLSSASLGGDWPQWRGPHRNGHTESASPFGPETRLSPVWTAEVGTGFSSIAVADGRVLTVGNSDNIDTLWCLSAADGGVLWKHSYPAELDPNLFEGGPTATPTISGGRAYIISRAGEIFCLDVVTGQVIWSRKVDERYAQNAPAWGYAGSPLVAGGSVFFNVGSHGLCLSTASGEVVWESDNSEQAGYTSPLLVRTGESQLLLLESEKRLNAVDPATGRVAWTLPWITRYGINAADPVAIDGEHVIVSSGYGKGTALIEFDAAGAREVWRVRDLKNQMSPGVLLGGSLFAVDGDAGQETRLVCLDPGTGQVRWGETGLGSGTLIGVNNQLLVLSEDGELVVIEANPETFAPLVRFRILTGKCWTPIAYADQMIFARNATGTIVGIRLGL